MASKVTLSRSLRSRESVKDVPEHSVKHVMELNTPVLAYVGLFVRNSKMLEDAVELSHRNSSAPLLQELFQSFQKGRIVRFPNVVGIP